MTHFRNKMARATAPNAWKWFGGLVPPSLTSSASFGTICRWNLYAICSRLAVRTKKSIKKVVPSPSPKSGSAKSVQPKRHFRICRCGFPHLKPWAQPPLQPNDTPLGLRRGTVLLESHWKASIVGQCSDVIPAVEIVDQPLGQCFRSRNQPLQRQRKTTRDAPMV